MDFEKFVECLSETEVNELFTQVYCRKTRIAEAKLKRAGYELNAAEIALLFNDQKIQAIKSVRERLGLGLYEAKLLVETYKPSPPYQGTSWEMKEKPR